MALPDEPMTRKERYLARLANQDVTIPDTPITREEEYLAYIIQHGGGSGASSAGGHNSTFRGKDLGTAYTSDQADAIDAGTFDDLYIGDYWEMPWGESMDPVKFRIAGFDTFFNHGPDGAYNDKHHLVIVPDEALATAAMNASNTTTGGYRATVMHATTLPGIVSSLESLFDGILTMASLVSIHTTNGQADEWGWVTGKAFLLNESLLYNTRAFGNYSGGVNVGDRMTGLPLFQMEPALIATRYGYCLQDVCSSTSFASVSAEGRPADLNASLARGVRPYICLGKASA